MSFMQFHVFKKMRVLFVCFYILGLTLSLCIASASWAMAEAIQTTVSEIVLPERSDEPTLVFLETNGRVLRLNHFNHLDNELIVRLQQALQSGETLNIHFSDIGTIDLVESLETTTSQATTVDDSPLAHDEENSFVQPLAMEREYLTPSQIFGFFSSMHLKSNSQCFHRAQLWTYDLWKYKGISTNKVFLFFTPLYIRKYNYKWWFHVSPYVENDYGDLVLDAMYARGPLQMQNWTNRFIKNGAVCPVLSSYVGTSSFNSGAYCHLRKVSMYYYHPARIANADRAGRIITEWDRVGLRDSQRARP